MLSSQPDVVSSPFANELSKQELRAIQLVGRAVFTSREIAALRGASVSATSRALRRLQREELVMLATRGHEAAMGYLRAAVLRGFADLRRIERAEAWTGMPRSTAFLKLVDAVPAVAAHERKWPGWKFAVGKVPADVETIESEHAGLVARIEAMSPALGPRLTTQWNRLLERVSVARLAAFLTQHPDSSGSRRSRHDRGGSRAPRGGRRALPKLP